MRPTSPVSYTHLDVYKRQNPNSWYLQSLLGNMYSDTYRQPDFEKAAEAYRRCV